MSGKDTFSRGGCPRCGKTIPFRSSLRRGRPFPCGDCGIELVVPKANTERIVGAMAGLLLFLNRLPFAVVLVFLGFGICLEWLLSPVSLAQQSTRAP